MGVIARLRSYHHLKTMDNYLIDMDKVHAQIEAGKHYSAHINSPTLGDGDSVEMYFKMPDSAVRCHTVVTFGAELGGVAEIRRTATVSLSGSVVTVFNDNHNSSNETTMTVRSSPTLTGSGTQVAHFHVGGGFQGRDGGDAGSRREFIGLQGTIYIARYTSIAGSNEADIGIAFYEE